MSSEKKEKKQHKVNFNIKEKLKKTIGLINEAMKTIISGMTDRDFINLSADMSTLEAVLQKDGLAQQRPFEQRSEGGNGHA